MSEASEASVMPRVTGGDAFFHRLCSNWDAALSDFRRLDASNRVANHLGPHEFALWMSLFGTPADEARSLFEHLDADGNGALQIEELLAKVRAAFPLSERSRLDPNQPSRSNTTPRTRLEKSTHAGITISNASFSPFRIFGGGG